MELNITWPLSRAGGAFSLGTADGGDKFRLGCPFHGSDKQRSLAVTLSKGSFKCYCCGAWGYLREGEPSQPINNSPPQTVIQDRPICAGY
jgi:hypothetical protein